MKGTSTESPLYPIYDLSNAHFGDVEIITSENKILKGQFVRFKVVNGKYITFHPSEKYCFVPAEHREEFWKAYDANGGEFKTAPAYIKELSLDKIHRIIITPTLVP